MFDFHRFLLSLFSAQQQIWTFTRFFLVKWSCHFGSTDQIKGQRSRGQRFNGPPKLNVRAQVKGPRLIPISSSIIFFLGSFFCQCLLKQISFSILNPQISYIPLVDTGTLDGLKGQSYKVRCLRVFKVISSYLYLIFLIFCPGESTHPMLSLR